jgi:hypothetical protein
VVAAAREGERERDALSLRQHHKPLHTLQPLSVSAVVVLKGGHMAPPPRRPCRISEGPQVKVVKLGAMGTAQ